MQPAKALGQSPRVDAVETIDGLGVLDGEIEQLLSTPHRREREHPSEHALVNFLPESHGATVAPGWTAERRAREVKRQPDHRARRPRSSPSLRLAPSLERGMHATAASVRLSVANPTL